MRLLYITCYECATVHKDLRHNEKWLQGHCTGFKWSTGSQLSRLAVRHYLDDFSKQYSSVSPRYLTRKAYAFGADDCIGSRT